MFIVKLLPHSIRGVYKMQKNSTNKKLISGWGRNHFVEAYSISPNSVQNVQNIISQSKKSPLLLEEWVNHMGTLQF